MARITFKIILREIIIISTNNCTFNGILTAAFKKNSIFNNVKAKKLVKNGSIFWNKCFKIIFINESVLIHPKLHLGYFDIRKFIL